ncbi:hypothetical protein, partial [Candidatus Magnetobacterium casense]
MLMTNFMMHEKTALTFSLVNWIVGMEENGKSSILRAIEFGHWRRNEYLPDGGEGVANIVRTGAKKCEVVIEKANDKTLKASYPPAGSEDILEGEYSSDIIKACLRCRWLLLQKETAQKEFFQNLLLPPWDQQAFIGALNNYHPDFPDLGERFWNYAVDDEAFPGIDIDKLYEIAKEGRKDAKKDKVTVDQGKPQHPGERPITASLKGDSVKQKDIDKAEKQLEEAIRVHEAERQKFDGAHQEYERELQSWRTMEFSRSHARSNLQRAQEEVEKAVKAIIPETEAADLKAYEKNLGAVIHEVEKIEKQIEKITKSDECKGNQAKCPKCGEKEFQIHCAHCGVDMAHYVDVIKKNETETGELGSLIAGAKKLRDQERELTNLLKEGIDSANKSRQSRLRADAAVKAEEVAKKQMEELGELPPQPEYVEPDRENLDALQTRLRAYKQALSDVTTQFNYNQSVERYVSRLKEWEGESQEIEAQVKMFEVICDALSPKGIKQQALRTVIEEFEQQVNKGLSVFGYKMKFSCEPWNILVDPGTGCGYVTIQFLSQSALSRASISLQVAIASVSGFGAVGIDEHAFGPSLRGILYEYLVEKAGVQSFVVSTLIERDEEGNMLIPEHPGDDCTKLFLVKMGKVSDI